MFRVRVSSITKVTDDNNLAHVNNIQHKMKTNSYHDSPLHSL